MSEAMSEPLLRVKELVKNFAVKGGVLRRRSIRCMLSIT